MMRDGSSIAERVALTIAGFDPSSGAGITADLAVFAAHAVFGISAITALTVQSTTGVRRSELVEPELLIETLACLQADLPPHGIKIGMLGGVEQVRAVATYLRPLRIGRARPLVVLDPVLKSSSGASLASPEAKSLLRELLLPLIDVITPNTEELSVLAGLPCQNESEIAAAARALAAPYGNLTVIATGGERPAPDDLLLHRGAETLLRGKRIETSSDHGTGCAFSSALLCGILLGGEMESAAVEAKRYVEQAMQTAVQRGNGRGPMNLLWPIARHGNH